MAALPVALLLLWEYTSRAGYLPPGIVPAPTEVATGMVTWIVGGSSRSIAFYSGSWLSNILASGERVLSGFLLAAGAGIVAGMLVASSRLAGELLDPTIQMLRPIPIVAWLPFTLALLGIRDSAAVFLIALGAFFPVFLNTAHGVRETRKVLVRAALMLGTSRFQLLYKVIIPSALPSIFTGLRLGVGMAWVGVVVSEMLAVKSGLGYVLWDAYYFGRMEVVIGTMITLGLLGFGCDQMVVLAGARILRWKALESHVV